MFRIKHGSRGCSNFSSILENEKRIILKTTPDNRAFHGRQYLQATSLTFLRVMNSTDKIKSSKIPIAKT